MHASTIRTLFGLAALLAATAAIAADNLYQWKDAKGVTHYSQTPPPAGTYKTQAVNMRDGSASAGEKTAVPDENPQCATARNNIALLESKRVVKIDSDGDGKPDKALTDADRVNQLELARATLKASCQLPTISKN